MGAFSQGGLVRGTAGGDSGGRRGEGGGETGAGSGQMSDSSQGSPLPFGTGKLQIELEFDIAIANFNKNLVRYCVDILDMQY